MLSCPTVIVLLAAAAVSWGVIPLGFLWRERAVKSGLTSTLVGVGSAFLLAAAIVGSLHGPCQIALPAPFSLGFAPFQFRTDPLADWFLALIAIPALAMTPYLSGYAAHMRGGGGSQHAPTPREQTDLRLFWIGLSWLLLSMALVLIAANAVCFLVFWELMSLTSFMLVATNHQSHSIRHSTKPDRGGVLHVGNSPATAAIIYLGSTRVGTALLASGFLWAHALTGTWSFAGWHLHGIGALGPGLLILCGLGVKAGMWPFHLWLPIAHPAAPAPVSALMSGVMVKVAVATIVRLYVVDHALANPAFAYVILALGTIGAIWGVLFALLQHDLKRLLAFHTVENIGLILMGIGVSLIAGPLGLALVAEVALASALFHSLNHAVFKSLLFLGAGAVDAAAGTRELGMLGGLGRRMPWTYACFALGAAAICGLPPLNGFASEWLLYQGFLRLATFAASPPIRFVGLLLIGWIGLVGALAMACFIKAIAVAFLGRARSNAVEHADEVGRGMIFSQSILASACVILGLAAPWVLRLLEPIVAISGAPAVTSGWNLPMGACALTLVATAALLWTALDRSSTGPGRPAARTYITWECGFGDLTPRAQVNGASFVQPIARMFGVVFRYVETLSVKGARLFPDEVTASTSTESVLESRVWRPAALWFGRAADRVLRLQEGSIHRYLITIFITLLILLAIGGYVR